MHLTFYKAFMNITEYTSNMMQNLGQQWCTAEKEGIDNPQISLLCADTERVVNYLNNPETAVLNNDEKIANLCRDFAAGFRKLGSADVESLAKWVAHHPEACNTLHHLLDVVKKKTRADNLKPANNDFLANLDTIVSKSLAYIKEDSDQNRIPKLPDEIKIVITQDVTFKGLLAMRLISKQYQEIANIALINRLNSAEISFTDLKIVTENDLFSFFGEDASKILYFPVDNENEGISDEVEKTSPRVLSFRQLSAEGLLYVRDTTEQNRGIVNNVLINMLNSGVISFSELNIKTVNDLKTFFDVRANDVVRLEIKASDVEVGADSSSPILCTAQLATTKVINLPLLFIDTRPSLDISALKYCTELEVLNMYSLRGNYDLSILSFCPKLAYLDISYTSIAELSGLKDCHALKEVNIDETKVTDISVLKELRKAHGILEKVSVKGCEIPEEDLQALFDLGVELVE